MPPRASDIQRHHADAARTERLTGGGYAQITPALRLAAGTALTLFRVSTAATGGGLYNCYPVKLNAGANWDTDSHDLFTNDETNGTVEVFNYIENNSDVHNLTEGDFIEAFQMTDTAETDNQGTVWVGKEWLGRHSFGEY